MAKGGIIMDVTNPAEARIAEECGVSMIKTNSKFYVTQRLPANVNIHENDLVICFLISRLVLLWLLREYQLIYEEMEALLECRIPKLVKTDFFLFFYSLSISYFCIAPTLDLARMTIVASLDLILPIVMRDFNYFVLPIWEDPVLFDPGYNQALEKCFREFRKLRKCTLFKQEKTLSLHFSHSRPVFPRGLTFLAVCTPMLGH